MDGVLSAVRHPKTGETFLLPRGCSQELFEEALSYQPDPTDVFVCSPPKCGTTWLQNIVWLILHKGKPVKIEGSVLETLPALDFSTQEQIKRFDNSVTPRIVKTHFLCHWVPRHPDAKYLYIARDPKDICASFYHHIIGMSSYMEVGLQFDDFFNLFMAGKLQYCDLFKHIQEWYAEKDNPHILFLLYEDLKRDLKKEVLKIAAFLGQQYERSLLDNNEAILKKVLHHSSFEEMKKINNKWCMVPRSEDEPFIRKGIVGDWKTHLSRAQAEAIQARIAATLPELEKHWPM